MIFEKATFSVDVEQLRRDYEQVRNHFAPHMVSTFYGGWSVTSSTGSYKDGWLKPGVNFEQVSKDMSREDYAKFVNESGQQKPILEYVKPTEACTEYLKSIIAVWSKMGLVPCRVRLALLKPGASSDWHQDAPDWLYNVRLHIPIVTNEGCIFETKTESTHIAADGSVYFVPVNNVHRVVNRGTTDRVHLIANIYDTKKVTQFHHYNGPRPAETGKRES